MYKKILDQIREWYILAIGLLIFGGLYVAYQGIGSSAPTSSGQSTQLQQSSPEREQALNSVASNSSREDTQPSAATFVSNPPLSSLAKSPTLLPQATAAATESTDTSPHDYSQSGEKTAAVVTSQSTDEVLGDPAAGQQVFKKCRACHSLEAGKNTLGPSLASIVGRKAGEVPNYNYSPALKNSNVVWNPEALSSYLRNPKEFLPGNKMAFPGLKKENELNDVIAYLASTSIPQQSEATAPSSESPSDAPAAKTEAEPTTPPAASAAKAEDQSAPPAHASQPSVSYIPDVRYTLRSGIAEGRMVFIGVGGTIDAQVNPVLSAADGQVVQITLLNGEGAEHDIVFPDFEAKSPRIVGKGASTTLVFRVNRAGDFIYICGVPGHQLAGMQGQFIVTPRPPTQVLVEADISQLPTEVPQPIGDRPPQTIKVDLLAVELEGRLAEGTTFGYWTFNGRVPGPMLRVRVGDTLQVHVKNSEDNSMIHSVDFHAATGPGGGAAASQVDPGQEKSFKFKALIPGLYVYHCATPMVAHHIANGMYGLILVEPEGGLPPVDREFYVMQGEIYTLAAFGQQGGQEFSVEKLLDERPEYFVFNGSVGALSKLHPPQAKVGDTVRIYFGVGGPNHTSSFHVIGEIFDRVYSFADVLSPPARGIQTITVPAGGATIVEFKVDVPGNYIMVDHALSRAERGLVGILHVEGPQNPEIFEGQVDPQAGH